MVLGVHGDGVYHQGEVAIRQDDRLMMFTDGITEAEREDGEQYGDDRLVDVVVANRQESAKSLVDAVLAATTSFTHGSLQDDATLVVAAIG
jgi:sigma-B regulation protein RsbU (phosphoserine phosphatase)